MTITHSVALTDTESVIGGVFRVVGHDGRIAKFRIYYDKINNRVLFRSGSYAEHTATGVVSIEADPSRGLSLYPTGQPILDSERHDPEDSQSNTAAIETARLGTNTAESLRYAEIQRSLFAETERRAREDAESSRRVREARENHLLAYFGDFGAAMLDQWALPQDYLVSSADDVWRVTARQASVTEDSQAPTTNANGVSIQGGADAAV